MHFACNETKDTFINNCWTPTDQTVLLHMSIGSSVARNNRYMQWIRIWRKQVSLGEKWSITGENKFNHKIHKDCGQLLLFFFLERSI